MTPSATRALPAAGAWTRLLPSWPWLIGLLVFVRLVGARMALLNDPDTYLHIAAGNWILAHAALPSHDPFSHSLPGAYWGTPEWLAEIALAAVYDHAGWGGIIALTAACIALAVGLLTRFLLRRLPPLPALLAAAASFALLEPHCLARPHALSLPLLVLWAGALLAARDDNRPPPYALLPVMALWANLHGSFLFGLALAGFLGGEAVLFPVNRSRGAAVRQWGLFVTTALAAALLAPHGVTGLLQPIRLVGMPALQTAFTEWRGPDFQHAPELELWVLGLMFIGFAGGVRLPPTRLVLLLGLTHMTLQHVRHADLLAIVGPLAVAAGLGGALATYAAGQAPSRLAAWMARLARPAALPAAGLVLAVAAAAAAPLMAHPIARSDDAVTPASALAAATRLGLSGPVLNSETFGGYLVFRGVPTFIDGRIEMYGNDFLAADVAAEHGDPAALRRLLARYHIAWALLLPYSRAAGVMAGLPGWEQVYADERAVVYRRTAAAGR